MPKTKHVLVLGSMPLIRHLRRSSIGWHGEYEITGVTSCEAAIDILRARTVDLAVLQYEVGGTWVLPYVRQIRNGETWRNRNVPIVVVTDPQGDDVLESYLVDHATSAGATACIPNPLSVGHATSQEVTADRDGTGRISPEMPRAASPGTTQRVHARRSRERPAFEAAADSLRAGPGRTSGISALVR